jgi:hypothetical protein
MARRATIDIDLAVATFGDLNVGARKTAMQPVLTDLIRRALGLAVNAQITKKIAVYRQHLKEMQRLEQDVAADDDILGLNSPDHASDDDDDDADEKGAVNTRLRKSDVQATEPEPLPLAEVVAEPVSSGVTAQPLEPEQLFDPLVVLAALQQAGLGAVEDTVGYEILSQPAVPLLKILNLLKNAGVKAKDALEVKRALLTPPAPLRACCCGVVPL